MKRIMAEADANLSVLVLGYAAQAQAHGQKVEPEALRATLAPSIWNVYQSGPVEMASLLACAVARLAEPRASVFCTN